MDFRRLEEAAVTAVAFRGVSRNRGNRYNGPMTMDGKLPRRILFWTMGLAAFAGLTGIAFSAWLGHGSAILLTLAETGMAWCF